MNGGLLLLPCGMKPIDGLDFCGDVKIFLDKYKLNADGHKVEIKNEQKLFKDSIVELIHNFDIHQNLSC